MAHVDFHDLEMAMMMLDDSSPDTQAWVSLDTGQVHVRSELVDPEDEQLPDDIDTSDRYVELPGMRDLDLGNRLVFAFVEQQLPEDYEQVRQFFRKKGAYSRFSQLLNQRGAVDKWHRFRDEQTEAAMREWCEQHGLELKS